MSSLPPLLLFLLFFARASQAAECDLTAAFSYPGDLITGACQKGGSNVSLCLLNTAVSNLQTASSTYMALTGTQSVSGAKTFTSPVRAPQFVLTGATNQILYDMPGTTSVTITAATPAASSVHYTYTFPDAGTSATCLVQSSLNPQNVNSQMGFTRATNQLQFGSPNVATLSFSQPEQISVYTVPDPGVAAASFAMTQSAQTWWQPFTFSSGTSTPLAISGKLRGNSTADITLTPTPAIGSPSGSTVGGIGVAKSLYVGAGIYIDVPANLPFLATIGNWDIYYDFAATVTVTSTAIAAPFTCATNGVKVTAIGRIRLLTLGVCTFQGNGVNGLTMTTNAIIPASHRPPVKVLVGIFATLNGGTGSRVKSPFWVNADGTMTICSSPACTATPWNTAAANGLGWAEDICMYYLT